MIYIKIHDHNGRKVIAACDQNLLGKTLETEELDFKISPHFYEGELKEVTELDNLPEHSSLNAIGKETVSYLIQTGKVKEQAIIKIQNIPHVIIINT